MPIYFGPPSGGSGGGPGPLPFDEAIVKNGDSVLTLDVGEPSTGSLAYFVIENNILENMELGPNAALALSGDVAILPATGSDLSNGLVTRTVANGNETFRLAANRVAVASGKTVVVRNAGGGAIGNGKLSVSNNVLTGLELNATEAVIVNGAYIPVADTNGANPTPAAISVTDNNPSLRLAPTVAIVEQGDTITATGGQTVEVGVSGGEVALTVKNWAFWEPFTVTVGYSDLLNEVGYMISDFTGDDQVGSITNEPVSGFLVGAVSQKFGSEFHLFILGDHAIAEELQGASVGIDGEDYSPEDLKSTWEGSIGMWVTEMRIRDVPAWTVDQQIPIVIMPQNGG